MKSKRTEILQAKLEYIFRIELNDYDLKWFDIELAGKDRIYEYFIHTEFNYNPPIDNSFNGFASSLEKIQDELLGFFKGWSFSKDYKLVKKSDSIDYITIGLNGVSYTIDDTQLFNITAHIFLKN